MDNSIPLLHCDGCNNDYPPTSDYFHRNAARQNGLDKYCKQCSKERNRLKYANAKTRPPKDVPSHLVCKQCGIPKPATTEFFGIMPTCRYGLKSSCKECINAIDRQRKEDSEWHESRKAQKREYHRTHKSEEAAKHVYWYQANRELVLEKDKQYRIDHPEILAFRWQRWAKTENGHAHCRTRVHNRKARKKGAEGNYTHADIQRIYKVQKGKCYYCHKKLDKYHIEHVAPIIRGGTNDPFSNIVLACPPCNLKKGTKLPHEWPEGGRLL